MVESQRRLQGGASGTVWEGVAYVPDEAFVHYSVSLQWQELCAPGEPVDPPIL